MPKWWYRGGGRWTWRMQREGRKVTGRGDYVLGTSRYTFFNTGVREARMHTHHRMVLAELQGEVPQRNGAYRMRRQGWPIKPRSVCPLTEGEAAFATIKGEVERMKRPMKAQ